MTTRLAQIIYNADADNFLPPPFCICFTLKINKIPHKMYHMYFPYQCTILFSTCYIRGFFSSHFSYVCCIMIFHLKLPHFRPQKIMNSFSGQIFEILMRQVGFCFIFFWTLHCGQSFALLSCCVSTDICIDQKSTYKSYSSWFKRLIFFHFERKDFM